MDSTIVAVGIGLLVLLCLVMKRRYDTEPDTEDTWDSRHY